MNFFRTTDTTIWKPGFKPCHEYYINEVESKALQQTKNKAYCVIECQDNDLSGPIDSRCGIQLAGSLET